MAEKKTATTGTKTSATRTGRETSSERLTEEELAAMKETLEERRKASRRAGGKDEGEADVRAKIAEMPESDRVMAERIHEIVKASGPDLAPRTWYGMPAYAKEGKVVCYFTAASKFKERYATFGFNASATLDEGNMWPTSFALKELTPADEKRIVALVKKAVS